MPFSQSNEAKPSAEQSTNAPSLALLTNVMGSLVFVIGLLVLIGWAQDIETLKRFVLGFRAMNPLAALNLVVIGLAILMARSKRWRGAIAAGGLVLLVSLAKVADVVWRGVPIDLLMFADKVGENIIISNAMAPSAAVAFALAALALIFAASRHRTFSLISQGLSVVVLAISLFALLGYILGVHSLDSAGLSIPMALHLSIALALVSVGLLSLTPDYGLMQVLRDTGPAGAMARIVLPMAVLIPIAVGAIRLWGQYRGYYGTETGVAISVVANVAVTSFLLTAAIMALHRSDGMRHRREQELRRSEASYRLAEQVAQVGHWRMDMPSLAVSWSDEVFDISGLSKGGGVPSAAEVLKIYHPDDRRIVRQSIREALREGRDWEYLIRLRRPNGELRHVMSHGVCERDDHGKLTGLFGVFADITDLEDARRRAEAASSAKATFLANMSHEIRTPLNGVMGFAELLLDSKLKAPQKRHATLIFESAQTLLTLLNDILDVSKIEAGQLQVAREPFDFAHQLRQCIRLMDGMAQKKDLALTLAVDPNLPAHILGDGLRVRQILLNLIGNAIKFTPQGSIKVNAAPAVSESGEPMLRIDVTDTGVGIPEARQAPVFEHFVQADVSTARSFGGSGLGLSISRSLATLMGGSITLTSREAEGTKVTLTLPLHAVTHPLRRGSDPTTAVVAHPSPDNAHSAGITILLAEDLDINQELITGMLERQGYGVEVAANGREAIHLASRLLTEPDAYGLILMDVQMPIVDGIEATRSIRSLGGRAATIPIVALTANAYESDVQLCRNAGMVDHLAKPVSMAQLGAMLSRWLASEQPVERRRVAEANQLALAARFAQRKAAYEGRLAELGEAFTTASFEDRAPLLAEVENIAHNLAGSAAMFGEEWLGEQASAIEDDLRTKAQAGAEPIHDLLEALRRAA